MLNEPSPVRADSNVVFREWQFGKLNESVLCVLAADVLLELQHSSYSQCLS